MPVMISLRRWMLAVAAAGFVASLAAGCATIGGTAAAEKVVHDRAQARWDALVERDLNTAYQYLPPAYRAVVPLKRYGNQFTGPVQWEGARVDSVSCEDKRCAVKVEITFRMLLPGHADRLASTFVDEVWILEDGQWYKFESV